MDLRTLQARWQLKLLVPEELPGVATQLLTEGAESPALAELAGLVRPTLQEATPILRRIFAQVEIPSLPRESALWRVAYAVAQDIVSDAVTPLDGATALWQIATDLEMPEPLRYFVYLAADYGEGPRDDATEAAWFDARIRETAQELLSAIPPDGESPPQTAA